MPKKKTRVLKATERRGICAELKSLDLRALLLEVEASIDKGLDLQCFPERKSFWDSIKGSEELHTLTKTASHKFVELYKLRAKGRDKYSYFYRDWLKYMLTFTTTEFETDLNRKQWDALASHHQGDVSDDTKRVILCGVLHGVQSRLQQIISSEIESISGPSCSTSMLPRGSDDVSLYRLGGWALLSAIKYRKKELKLSPGKLELQQELMLLQLLTVSQEEKINLPAALRYLDRGRLTFPQPSIIPFLRALEDRMLEILNETNYKRYGKRLFQVGQKLPLPQYILRYSILFPFFHADHKDHCSGRPESSANLSRSC